MTIDYAREVKLRVDFEWVGREVLGYSLVLLMETDRGVETVRVYDSAHGFNEMHRYTREGGKQLGVEVHRGTLGEGMRAAIKDIKDRYPAMIEGWERWR
jgi:hypothetical protein